MKEIQLTQGKVAIIDSNDFEKLSQFKWYFHEGYARTDISNKRLKIYMHRMIIGDGEYITDHINSNRLDNRKSNLRKCTFSQNSVNKFKVNRKTTSKYKGVYFASDRNKWRVQVGRNKIGSFNTEQEAAIAYNKKAVEIYGEFAKLNEVLL